MRAGNIKTRKKQLLGESKGGKLVFAMLKTLETTSKDLIHMIQ